MTHKPSTYGVVEGYSPTIWLSLPHGNQRGHEGTLGYLRDLLWVLTGGGRVISSPRVQLYSRPRSVRRCRDDHHSPPTRRSLHRWPLRSTSGHPQVLKGHLRYLCGNLPPKVEVKSNGSQSLLRQLALEEGEQPPPPTFAALATAPPSRLPMSCLGGPPCGRGRPR